MIPHKLNRQAQKIYDEMFNPSRMKLLIYDDELPYDRWLEREQIKCGSDFAYLFVLKLKEGP